MSNISDLYPSGGIGGGGLKPRFQEFLTSGTFTPTQALIDGGGMITVLLVASGGSSNTTSHGGNGGEVIEQQMYLTGTASCAVVIGGSVTASNGVDSIFNGSGAGGQTIIARGGSRDPEQVDRKGASWGSIFDYDNGSSDAGSGTNGFGAGGGKTGNSEGGGIETGAANSGQGSGSNRASGSGYCLITWWE